MKKRYSKRKYGNKKVLYDGIVFDSKKEQQRYTELKHLERIGLITGLELQKPYELIPSQREPSTLTKRGKEKKGKVIEQAVKYIADFVYTDKDGHLIVEDTKGKRTEAYIIKRKLMLYVHGIRITEV